MSDNGWYVPPEDRVPSPNKSKRTKHVRMIVLHTTIAVRKTANNRARIERWYREKGKSSSHFCILRDGTLLQGVSIDEKAWHAGESEWTLVDGTKVVGCNNVAIGIDFDSLGRLNMKNGQLTDYYGNPFWGVAVQRGRTWYEAFTREQIDTACWLIPKLCCDYDIDTHDVVGHYDVSPDRKTDPEEAIFPWRVIYGAVWDAENNRDQTTFEESADAVPAKKTNTKA